MEQNRVWHSPPFRSIPLFSSSGRCVGQIVSAPDGTVWLVKSGLDPKRHKLRCPPGWATDVEHLEQLRKLGGAGVRLVLKTGTVLEARLEDFDHYGRRIDRGFGPQVALPEAYWRRSGNEQLSLFGEEAVG